MENETVEAEKKLVPAEELSTRLASFLRSYYLVDIWREKDSYVLPIWMKEAISTYQRNDNGVGKCGR